MPTSSSPTMVDWNWLFIAGMLVGVAGCLFGLVWLWLMVFRGPSRSATPLCGRCKYTVYGISSMQCPECGADLREVGIRSPLMNRVAGPIHFLADWTIGLAFVAAILSIGLATLGPQTPWHLSVTYELTPKQGQVGTVRISPTYYRPFASPSKANQPSSRIKRSGQPTEVAIDAGLQEQAVPE